MIASNTVRIPYSAKGKILTNYKAAKLLKVSLSHLGRVLKGQRVSKKLLSRYQELQAQLERSAK